MQTWRRLRKFLALKWLLKVAMATLKAEFSFTGGYFKLVMMPY